jgi:hypothetical protein
VLAGAKGVDDMPAFGSRAGDAFKAYKVTKLAGKVGKVGDVAEIGGKAITGDVKGAAAAGVNTLSGVAAGAGAGFLGCGPLCATVVGAATALGADFTGLGDRVVGLTVDGYSEAAQLNPNFMIPMH